MLSVVPEPVSEVTPAPVIAPPPERLNVPPVSAKFPLQFPEPVRFTVPPPDFVKSAELPVITPLKVERFDGEPLIGSGHEPLLVSAGFSRQPRKLVVPA